MAAPSDRDRLVDLLELPARMGELAPRLQRIEELLSRLVNRGDTLEPLSAITGQSVRAAAAYERRHPEIAQLAVMVGRRRMYRRAEVLAVMGQRTGAPRLAVVGGASR